MIMKHFWNPIRFLLFVLVVCCHVEATELSVMSYNIRLNVESDGINQWSNRKVFWMNQVGFHHPDFIGVQEARPDQMRDIEEGLTGYAFVGVGRDDGADAGEYSAVFFDATRWKMLESSTFWLSETPDVPSKSWDAAYPRICTYGKFESIETGEVIWIFNTHLDHIGEVARLEGVKLILEKIEALTDEKDIVFFTGDFNALPDSAPVKAILATDGFQDTRAVCNGPILGPEATFTGFNYHEPAENRIDYVFFRDAAGRVDVNAFATLTDAIEGRFPSDHFPVIAKCEVR